MSYYDNQEAKVKISYELKNKGWKIYGYRADQSDMMTDYWCPAHWNGIATKNGYVLVIDNHSTHYSGYEVKKYNYSNQESRSNARIDKLTAMMNDSASTENEKASCATLIEKELEKLGVTSEPSYTVIETYPTFHYGNPKSCTWHIEKDNQIIAKGKGVFSANDYDWENKEVSREQQKADNMNKFINRIEAAIKQDSALESEVIKVAKTSIKPVQKADKTINVGDVLSFSYHGHFWVVTNIYTVGEQVRVTYELLGSEKRGYQRLSGMSVKRYYQVLKRLEKEIEEGKTKVYTLQEVTEYEEKTVYKKTAKKQPKADFNVEAITGDVAEVTTDEVKTEQTKKETAATNNTVNNDDQVTINFNKEKNGIEIKFNVKPSASVIASLKENGFRWFQPKGFWCAKQSPERLEFAQSLCNGTTAEQQTEEQETTQAAPEAHNSTTEENPDVLMVDILADSLTDYIIACGKPQTDEEKEKANKHILGYMISRELEPTEGMLAHMQREYPFLYSIVTHNSSKETKQEDPYTFNVDTAYTYHDIHFKAWNMELSEIEEFMNAYEIPFYITCDKFICQGLTLDQVATVEEINTLNAAIIFYDNKYNEVTQSTYNSSIEEERQILTPFEYGTKAFERGISCAPALDNEFLETYIKGLKVGEGGAELMKEWVKGWTKANLDAPFDFDITDITHNSNTTNELDNVVYYNFSKNVEEEEEKEIEAQENKKLTWSEIVAMDCYKERNALRNDYHTVIVDGVEHSLRVYAMPNGGTYFSTFDIDGEWFEVKTNNMGYTWTKHTKDESCGFDDILSKFDDIEVTTESRIAADDLEFCKEQESIYNELISTYNSFYEKLQQIGEISKEHGQKFGRQSGTYFHEQNTAHYHSMRKWDYEKAINEMKNSFILYVCSYFMKKYNVTIDYYKLQNKYNESVTYEQILDEIYIQLDGFNFTEKAEKEIKDQLKDITYNKYNDSWNIEIKNNTITIDTYLRWSNTYKAGEVETGYEADKITKPIFAALSHFETGNAEIIKQFEQFTKNYRLTGHRDLWFTPWEIENSKKIFSVRFYKNGRIDIKFEEAKYARQFAHEYCGYKQQTA